ELRGAARPRGFAGDGLRAVLAELERLPRLGVGPGAARAVVAVGLVEQAQRADGAAEAHRGQPVARRLVDRREARGALPARPDAGALLLEGRLGAGHALRAVGAGGSPGSGRRRRRVAGALLVASGAVFVIVSVHLSLLAGRVDAKRAPRERLTSGGARRPRQERSTDARRERRRWPSCAPRSPLGAR